jgi:multidrug efflux pump subunit AcrB
MEFYVSRSIDLAVQDVNAKIAQIRSRLPKEVTAITVSKKNPEDQPIMLLSLESNEYPPKDLMLYLSDRLKDQFAMVPRVSDIVLGGYVDPNLRIWVSRKKLRDLQISVDDVIASVQSEHSERPAGEVNDHSGDHMFYVRPLGESTSVEQFSNIVINQRSGAVNFCPTRLGLGILNQRGSNVVEVAKAVRAKIKVIQASLVLRQIRALPGRARFPEPHGVGF